MLKQHTQDVLSKPACHVWEEALGHTSRRLTVCPSLCVHMGSVAIVPELTCLHYCVCVAVFVVALWQGSGKDLKSHVGV